MTQYGGHCCFSGEYEHNIDAKGRLTLPVKLREGLGNVVYLTRGIDGCLFLFPEQRWLEIIQQAGHLPVTKLASRTFARMLYASTSCEVDKLGRVLLPASLRRYASLTDLCVIVGIEDRVELWSPLKWEEAMNLLSKADDDNIAGEWAELGR